MKELVCPRTYKKAMDLMELRAEIAQIATYMESVKLQLTEKWLEFCAEQGEKVKVFDAEPGELEIDEETGEEVQRPRLGISVGNNYGDALNDLSKFVLDQSGIPYMTLSASLEKIKKQKKTRNPEPS